MDRHQVLRYHELAKLMADEVGQHGRTRLHLDALRSEVETALKLPAFLIPWGGLAQRARIALDVMEGELSIARRDIRALALLVRELAAAIGDTPARGLTDQHFYDLLKAIEGGEDVGTKG